MVCLGQRELQIVCTHQSIVADSNLTCDFLTHLHVWKIDAGGFHQDDRCWNLSLVGCLQSDVVLILDGGLSHAELNADQLAVQEDALTCGQPCTHLHAAACICVTGCTDAPAVVARSQAGRLCNPLIVAGKAADIRRQCFVLKLDRGACQTGDQLAVLVQGVGVDVHQFEPHAALTTLGHSNRDGDLATGIVLGIDAQLELVVAVADISTWTSDDLQAGGLPDVEISDIGTARQANPVGWGATGRCEQGGLHGLRCSQPFIGDSHDTTGGFPLFHTDFHQTR